MNRIERIFRGVIASAVVSIAILLTPALTPSASAAPPVNETPPTLSPAGDVTAGTPITLQQGTWDSDAYTISDSWQECSAATVCTAITPSGSSYTPSASEAGDAITVTETATNPADSPNTTTMTSSNSVTVVPPAPTSVTPPSLNGSSLQGGTLTATTGSWNNSPDSYSYTWLDCTGSPLNCTTSATSTDSNTYAVTSADVGAQIEVEVTAMNAGGSGTATSAAQPVTIGVPVNTKLPALTGSSNQGGTLTAAPGTWTNTPTSYSYVWLDCAGSPQVCTVSATSTNSATYSVTAADAGAQIEVQVTAANGAGNSAPADSSPQAATVGLPVVQTAPTITGALQSGSTLQETDGTWTNTPTLTRQWLRCAGSSCTAVSTGTSYPLTSGDLGDTIELVVTASNAAGSATASATSGTITLPPPVNTAPPTISGTAQVGQTVTAQTGHWTGSDLTTSWQWLLCDSSGNNCAAISGATGATYVVAAGNAGGTLQVEQTQTNSGGSVSAYSGLTGAVTDAAGVVPAPSPKGSLLPTISGQPQLGSTLSATAVAFSNNGETADQWLRCNSVGCSAIEGASNLSYTISAADVGETLAFQESSTNAGGTAQVSSGHTDAVTASTSTSLQAAAVGVAGRSVSMVAVVSTGAPAGDASGTIAFASNGQPIPGCTAMSLTAGSGQPVICAASFGAADQTITATFVPAAGAFVSSSASSPVTIDVRTVDTRVVLTSSPRVGLNKAFTYRAALRPRTSGSLAATGRVRFLDGAHTIGHCARQKVSNGQASCAVTYRDTGDHVITARYAGDGSFAPAISPPQHVTVAPQSPTGVVNAFMSWTFAWGPHGTRVRALTITGLARGTSIAMSCAGAGCAFHHYVHRVHGTRQHAASFDLTPVFRGRRLGVGSRLTVRLAHAGWLGKYYHFTIRSGHRPALEESCLAVGGTRPSVGCTAP